MIANVISKAGKSLSEIVKPLRKYHSTGEINSKVDNPQAIMDEIKAKYSDGNQYELDGISTEYDDWWFNVRLSNTEPLMRLIVEAKSADLMNRKRDELLSIIRE